MPVISVKNLYKDFQKVDATEQGALSTSRGADNDHLLSALDLAGNVVQNAEAAKAFANILNVYHLLSTSFLSV